MLQDERLNFWRRYWFLTIAGLLLLCWPASRFVSNWDSERSLFEWIILVTGVALLVRQGQKLPPGKGNGWVTAAVLAVVLPTFVVATVIGSAWFQWAGTCGAFAALFYHYGGWPAIGRLAFPLIYLLLAAQLPPSLVTWLTQALTLWLSTAATTLLWWAGYDAAHLGTTLYINQYELRMVDACSGLKSLFSLIAIGIFYLHVRYRSDWRHLALMSLVMIPIAIFANLLRVLALMFTTIYLGDAAAQGIIHLFTGLFVFVVSLLVLIALDPLFQRLHSGGRVALPG